MLPLPFMNDVFRRQLNKTVSVYLEDIPVFSKSLEQHIEHLRDVLQTCCRLC